MPPATSSTPIAAGDEDKGFSVKKILSNSSIRSLTRMRRKTWNEMTPQSMRKFEYGVIITLATGLAAVAGCINAVTFLAYPGMTPSHVTGAITKGGVAGVGVNNGGGLAQSMPIGAAACMHVGMVLAFLCGSFSCGLFAEGEVWQLGKRYGHLLLLEGIALWFAYALYYSDFQFYAMFLSAYACGLQNALGTKYSGAVVRTVHMTGAITDIGSTLGQYARLGSEAKDTWKLKFLIPLVLAYFIGCAGGAYLFPYIGYNAMIVPASMVTIFGLVYGLAQDSWMLKLMAPLVLAYLLGHFGGFYMGGASSAGAAGYISFIVPAAFVAVVGLGMVYAMAQCLAGPPTTEEDEVIKPYNPVEKV